jgi:flagellar basal body-associated protein FliL
MDSSGPSSEENKSPTVGMYDRPERKGQPLLVILLVVLMLIALGTFVYFFYF